MIRPMTHQSYLDRLNRVDDYIYAHLDSDLSIERLADIACLSPYHWSRIYAAVRGETVAARIRRLRLQRAADRLANSDTALKDIAQRAGYTAPESFSRAFREAFGETPGLFCETGAHTRFRMAESEGASAGFPVSVIDLPEQRCLGVDHTGPYLKIDHAMRRLFAELARRGAVPHDPLMIGVFFDDPDLGDSAALRSRACLTVAATVAAEGPLIETRIKAGRYARLRYTGPYAAMGSAYRWLLGCWLPASGHEPGDAPVFESYLNDPGRTPQAELRTDIHLPLRMAE